jgi:hypothetical protein
MHHFDDYFLNFTITLPDSLSGYKDQSCFVACGCRPRSCDTSQFHSDALKIHCDAGDLHVFTIPIHCDALISHCEPLFIPETSTTS